MASPDVLLDSINRLTGQQLGVLRTIQGVMGRIHAAVSALRTGGRGKSAKKSLDETGGGLGGIVSKLKVGLGVIGGVVAGLASIPAAIVGIVKSAQTFVRALNPSLVERYEREVDNLRATVGFGLTPVIAYATRNVREFAGLLLPIVRRVQPIVDLLARSVSGAVSGAARLVARLAEQTAGIAERLAPFVARTIDNLADLFDVVSAVVGVFDGLGTAMKVLETLFGANATGLRAMTAALAVATARLLGAFGGAESLNKFKEGLRKAIEDRKKPVTGGLTAAPKDATTGGIEDVLRKLNERAFVATSGPATKPPDVQALEDILREVEGIEPKNWKQVIFEAVRDAFAASVPTPGGVARAAGDVISGRSDSTGGAFDLASRVTGFLMNPGAALVGG